MHNVQIADLMSINCLELEQQIRGPAGPINIMGS